MEAPPEPVTPLAKYRILSSTCGLRVSPFQFGTMGLGNAWAGHMGPCDKDQAFKLLDTYFEAGGNFIDTASMYQNEEAETLLGEWMQSRNNRDQLVIATKYTTDYKSYQFGKGVIPNHCGNHKRSLHMSLRDSLKKLQTDWIDILYLHWWDHTTSTEEIMDALHLVVQQGKVLYLGVSDTPAWVVSAANTYARLQGKTPFVIYQGRWNIMLRDFERDILPMARHFGMALAPWEALGGGKFQTRKALEDREKRGEDLRGYFGNKQSEDERKISDALETVADQLGGTSLTAVALAYVMSKAPNVFPIVGGRKIEHLQANIEALKIRLTKEQIEYLETVLPFDLGFPGNLFGADPKLTGKPHPNLGASGVVEFVQSSRAIGYEGY